MKRSPFPLAVTLGTVIFLYLPVLILIVDSFNASRFSGEWEGFTLKWYEGLLKDRGIWKALQNSLIVAVSATLASTIMGTAAAYCIHRFKTGLQRGHWGLIVSPLFVPDILTGVSLLIFFVVVNIQLGLFTIFLAHTTFCMSYVTFLILSRLQNYDFSVIEAALDLGARGWQITTKIFIPMIAPALLAAALLSFTMSFDDFVITFFVTGPGSTTLPIYVYGMIKYGSTPLINALSCLILLVTFVTVGLTQYFSGEFKK